MSDNNTTHQEPAEISLTITENHENEDDPKTQQEEEKVDETTPTFTCEICIEPIDATNMRTVTDCAHPYCTDCMVKYIRARLEDDDRGPAARRIKCPSPDCPRELDPGDWAGPVGPALFVRWCDALCESSLSGLDSCRCPRPSCGELVVDECGGGGGGGGGAMKSRCPKCKTDFCFACKRFWHAGSHCGEQAAGRSGSAAFRRLAKRKHWKRCPSCQHYVELNGGCNSVICRCGTSFCYGCGRNWSLCNCRERWNSLHRCCRVIGFTMLVLCGGLVLLVPFLPFLLMS